METAIFDGIPPCLVDPTKRVNKTVLTADLRGRLLPVTITQTGPWSMQGVL